ncbi:MAG TPA: RNB domain-containing ribonuclease [Steroidobacteraceae bacterium]|nr:RNB domain-containing ribonuclease [Steroidobacteraceae bacterium]
MTSVIELRAIARRAMLARGLLPEFSREALQEANRMQPLAMRPSPAMRDLRTALWASIDNDDSLDLDQLSVAQELAGGAARILIAIADVDALVARGSAIDEHAHQNTTSVYTAAQIFPMLPERLSTDLTSLREGQERPAVIIDMSIAAEGAVLASDVYRALVCNRAKLAYGGVGAWLEGRGPAPERVAAVPGMDAQLRLQDRVAQSLRRVRQAHGALTLCTIEARPVFDSGALTDLRAEQTNRAHELIEDFMIAANGVTARFLEQKGFPSLRRVLRTPQRWDRLVALAESLGEHLPATPSPAALNEFLLARRARDPTGFPDLSLSVIKLLGRGEYVAELPGDHSPGHFGLAVSDYAHSTAPNRRFPDVIAQRLIKTALAGLAPAYAAEELAALAAHCTQQEDSAARVERQVQKSAAALLLQRRIGQEFAALVTGVTEQGTWVRIAQPAVEGKLVRGFERLDVGDRLLVRLVHTDIEHGFIDFARSQHSA